MNLQRIKKANGNQENIELDYQIKGVVAKLSSMGINVEDLTLWTGIPNTPQSHCGVFSVLPVAPNRPICFYKLLSKNAFTASAATSSSAPSMLTVTISPCFTHRLIIFISCDAYADFPSFVTVTTASLYSFAVLASSPAGRAWIPSGSVIVYSNYFMIPIPFLSDFKPEYQYHSKLCTTADNTGANAIIFVVLHKHLL